MSRAQKQNRAIQFTCHIIDLRPTQGHGTYPHLFFSKGKEDERHKRVESKTLKTGLNLIKSKL